MRVYKFLTTEHALDDIRDRKIKISEIHDLNDPFELVPFDVSERTIRTALLLTRDELNKKNGVVCFSRYWWNPLLWAHYSDKHRGMCLGFDVPEDGVAESVTYVQDRLPFKMPPNEKLTKQMLFTKFDGWSYEEEVRIYASREEEENGNYFAKVDDNRMMLREIIAGARCCVERNVIAAALKSYLESEPVNIIKARLSYTSFKVIEDPDGLTD